MAEGLEGFVLQRADRRAKGSTKMWLGPQQSGVAVGLDVVCHTLGKRGRTLCISVYMSYQ